MQHPLYPLQVKECIFRVWRYLMTENIIERTLRAIKSADHSPEAARRRLLRAGIITKSGRLSKIYREPATVQK